MWRYQPLVEDPMYDDDGILVDEDADFEDIEVPEESYDPHNTVNS